MVSSSRHNCLKHRPAVPFGWCRKRGLGAVLVKMVWFLRLLSGLGGVLAVFCLKGGNMEKKHISLWLDEELLNECDELIKDGSAKNRSEYFENALHFYNCYLKGKNYDEIIGQTLMKVFQSTLNSFGNRVARQMFKQAVETSKIFWLLVKEKNINPEYADILHESSIEEVKKINGAIQFPYNVKDDE